MANSNITTIFLSTVSDFKEVTMATIKLRFFKSPEQVDEEYGWLQKKNNNKHTILSLLFVLLFARFIYGNFIGHENNINRIDLLGNIHFDHPIFISVVFMIEWFYLYLRILIMPLFMSLFCGFLIYIYIRFLSYGKEFLPEINFNLSLKYILYITLVLQCFFSLAIMCLHFIMYSNHYFGFISAFKWNSFLGIVDLIWFFPVKTGDSSSYLGLIDWKLLNVNNISAGTIQGVQGIYAVSSMIPSSLLFCYFTYNSKKNKFIFLDWFGMMIAMLFSMGLFYLPMILLIWMYEWISDGSITFFNNNYIIWIFYTLLFIFSVSALSIKKIRRWMQYIPSGLTGLIYLTACAYLIYVLLFSDELLFIEVLVQFCMLMLTSFVFWLISSDARAEWNSNKKKYKISKVILPLIPLVVILISVIGQPILPRIKTFQVSSCIHQKEKSIPLVNNTRVRLLVLDILNSAEDGLFDSNSIEELSITILKLRSNDQLGKKIYEAIEVFSEKELINMEDYYTCTNRGFVRSLSKSEKRKLSKEIKEYLLDNVITQLLNYKPS